MTVLEDGLSAIPEAHKILADELRRMAAAEGEYLHFSAVSPWVKNIWYAAADALDGGRLH